jgi:hypothetical protein
MELTLEQRSHVLLQIYRTGDASSLKLNKVATALHKTLQSGTNYSTGADNNIVDQQGMHYSVQIQLLQPLYHLFGHYEIDKK